MGKCKEFNGHKNWNHWNVSLWLSNDETMYREAVRLCRIHGKGVAAQIMLDWLEAMQVYKTPDGAPYTKTSVRAALRDL